MKKQRQIKRLRNIKKEKGITLIALVVTIIVLLILAGVAINLSIGNNGLFTRAENATNTWRKAEANEQEEMSNFESLYDNTLKDLGLNGSGNGGGNAKPVEEITGEEITNTEVVDKNGDKAFIPAGFTVDPENNTVAEGLVIIDKKGGNEDTVGNQFVWISCEIETEENKNNGKLKYDRYVFTRDGWTARQSLVLGTNGEYEKDSDGSYKIQANYVSTSYYYHEAMSEQERASVEKYGGYYIGRYEVGCDTARSSSDKGNITATAKVKTNLPVYNYVTREEAVTIAERMYAGKSRLCSSYAWDTALKFIDGESGTYAVNSVGDNNRTTSSRSKLENTGYHEEKNIYDMGGNVWEWTTEAYT